MVCSKVLLVLEPCLFCWGLFLTRVSFWFSPDSVDYEVGLVSGSLSKSRPSPGSGSLSALFSSTTAPASVLFHPAPEVSPGLDPV